ncbi:MAG: 3'-5' exonuclease [Candidatus Nanopelagicales bacterium]
MADPRGRLPAIALAPSLGMIPAADVVPPAYGLGNRLEWGMFTYPVPNGRHTHEDAGYAVIDLETTGFNARGQDRIVEIAIVRVDAAGRELGTYETLVDPGRSTGPESVHRITDAMVSGAPRFAEIAGSLLAWLEGVVIVAHNAQFEDAFLSAEFERAGLRVPELPALDTLPLAQARVPTRDHRLATVCAWAGVRIDGAHTALGDARATAQMLPPLLRASPKRRTWNTALRGLGGAMGGRYLPRTAVEHALTA